MSILLRRCLVLLLFTLLLSTAGYSQFGIPTQMQRGVQDADIRNRVAQYCRLDYMGARLSEKDWQKLKPVVSWPSNPDFPLIDVVSRYEVDANVTSSHGKWNVTVHYHLLGRFNVGEGYSTEIAGNVRNVDFTVSEANGELKVTGADPNYPRPSRAAMLKWLQEKQAAATDASTKIIYEQAIKELSAQSGSPFAK